MSPRYHGLLHGLAMVALLVSLPTIGYLLSLPAGTLPVGSVALLGIVALGAVALASASAGSARAEVDALRSEIARRDGTISRLNELAREDERLIGILSSMGLSVKGEGVARGIHGPGVRDDMTARHGVPESRLDVPSALAAKDRPDHGGGPQEKA